MKIYAILRNVPEPNMSAASVQPFYWKITDTRMTLSRALRTARSPMTQSGYVPQQIIVRMDAGEAFALVRKKLSTAQYRKIIAESPTIHHIPQVGVHPAELMKENRS